MQRVGEHPVPAGPLAVRWLGWELREPPRAGKLAYAELALENAGATAWRGIELSYHWLDDRGNAIVWDGRRTELGDVEPGRQLELEAPVSSPIPPGRYVLAFDLVLEGRYWFSELGNPQLELELTVAPRIGRRLAVQGVTVESQQEPLVPLHEAEAVAYLVDGCEPAPDWSRRVLDAHQEGYALVGGSIDAGRNPRLAPWSERSGRNPSFGSPLLCPSVVKEVVPNWTAEVEGLPAATAPDEEPWIYDGRVRIRARPQSGRRRG